jgi:hypothetical protein
VGVEPVLGWTLTIVAVLGLGLVACVVVLALRMHRALVARFRLIESWVREYRLEQSRDQASQVCAWPISEKETYEKVLKRGVVGAAVRNASQLPVYQLEIVYRDPDAAWSATRTVRIVPPAAAPEIYAGFDTEETIGEPSPERINADGSISLAPSAQMRIELRFTDSQGRRWVRSEGGELTPVA